MKNNICKIAQFFLALAVLALAINGAYARAGNTDLVPPSITVSDAVGANPGTVYTAAQNQKTVNVAWNAGSDYTYCEIYYTVNIANQTELGRGHDGTKPLTVQAGSMYEIWMVVYPGNGQFLTVARLNVVAKQGNPPGTTTPPPSGGGSLPAGTVDAVSDKPSENSQAYRNAPFIQDLRVQPDSRNVIISFASNQTTPALVEIGKVKPVTDRFGVIAFGFDSGAFSRFVTPQNGRYTLEVDVLGEQLEIGTTYYYIINVFNNNRNDTKRPREQVTGQFNTLPQTVKVVWEKVHLFDDSDDFSTGECLFWFWANYGQPSQQYTDYYNKDVDSGEDYNFNRPVVIENAPDNLKLEVSGEDADGTTIFFHGRNNPTAPLNGPGDNSVFGKDNDVNAAKQEFDLSKFPGNNVKVPFRLETRGGSLKFVVFGHLEITRGPAVQIGTTSSPLKTDPPPIKAQGRIPHQPGTPTTPLPICVAAQRARESNSPAAPGLEAQCAAQEPVKAQRRVPPQPGTLTAPLPICVAAQQARERNSPAARGLEEKCLAQEPVKALGRVRPAPGTEVSPPKPICESARLARERNSPAARGLEEKCRSITKGEQIANQDPLAVELRGQQSGDRGQDGFNFGMALAEGHTAPGPGKDNACADLSSKDEQDGCRIAVLFSVERNRNAVLAKRGAEITQADQDVADARNAETDVFYRLGFDIGLAASEGHTAPGPGKDRIRDSLAPALRAGFSAAVSFTLERNRRK